MLIVKVNKDKGGIESAIKDSEKIRRTKKINRLREGKEYTKPQLKKTSKTKNLYSKIKD